MGVNLWFVCARAHNPFAIFADSNTSTRLLELEILEDFDPVGIFGVFLLFLLLFLRQPVRKTA